MKHTITLIPGDGIGPEVTNAVVQILETAGLQVEWEPHAAGVLAVEQHGNPLPAVLIDSILRNKVALKGPVTTPVGGGFTIDALEAFWCWQPADRKETINSATRIRKSCPPSPASSS